MACSINNVLIETVQKYLSINVPLNPSMPEKFILPNVGTLLHYCFTLDAIRFNNTLLFILDLPLDSPEVISPAIVEVAVDLENLMKVLIVGMVHSPKKMSCCF
jgi:hypothetical protein